MSHKKIISIIGNVSHGKTTIFKLLSEHAYTERVMSEYIEIAEVGDYIFIDTPGHTIFSILKNTCIPLSDAIMLVCDARELAKIVKTIDIYGFSQKVLLIINKVDTIPIDELNECLNSLGIKDTKDLYTIKHCFNSSSAHLLEALDMMDIKPHDSNRHFILEHRHDKQRGHNYILFSDQPIYKGQTFSYQNAIIKHIWADKKIVKELKGGLNTVTFEQPLHATHIIFSLDKAAAIHQEGSELFFKTRYASDAIIIHDIMQRLGINGCFLGIGPLTAKDLREKHSKHIGFKVDKDKNLILNDFTYLETIYELEAHLTAYADKVNQIPAARVIKLFNINQQQIIGVRLESSLRIQDTIILQEKGDYQITSLQKQGQNILEADMGDEVALILNKSIPNIKLNTIFYKRN